MPRLKQQSCSINRSKERCALATISTMESSSRFIAAGLTIESARHGGGRSDPAQADRLLEQCVKNLNATIRDVRAYITGLAPKPAPKGRLHAGDRNRSRPSSAPGRHGET